MTRQRAVAGAALVVAVSAAVAWALAWQQNSLAATLVRAAADVLAVVALGLTAVPMLDIDRYRGELIRRATVPLTIAGALWLVAELLRLVGRLRRPQRFRCPGWVSTPLPSSPCTLRPDGQACSARQLRGWCVWSSWLRRVRRRRTLRSRVSQRPAWRRGHSPAISPIAH